MSATTTEQRLADNGALLQFVKDNGGLVLAYQRISKDVTAERLGVSRQRNDCDGFADARGLEVDTHYADNSISGWSGKIRPEFSEMMRLVAEGKVAVIIAWHIDRLTRNPMELEQLISVLRDSGTKLVTVTAGDLDPTSESGLLMARMTGAVAAYESDHKSRRITRKHLDMAERGEFHGGRRRFGYEKGMAEIREDEADVIRAIAGRLLAGETLHSCAKWLNEQGVATPGGGAGWTGSNLGLMILRPHLAGLRVHKGDVVGRATWEPILDVADHESLKHLLKDPARRTSFSNARVYLLAGLARCDECGLPLRGRTRKGTKDPTRVYICQSSRHVHRTAADVDEVVEAIIVKRLEESDVAGVIKDDTAADAVANWTIKLAELVQERDELGAQLVGTGLSASAIAGLMRAIEQKIQAAEHELEEAKTAARRPQVALEGMTGSAAREAWTNASLGRKRAVLDLLTESITLRGSQRNARRGVDADDIEVVWASL